METNQIKFKSRTRVTTGACQTYKDNGLTEIDGVKWLDNVHVVMSDPMKLKEVAERCFEGDFKEIDFEDLEFDPQNLKEALCFFGECAFGINRKLVKPTADSSPKK